MARLFYLCRRLEPSLLAVSVCADFDVANVQYCSDNTEEVKLFYGAEADYSEGILYEHID